MLGLLSYKTRLWPPLTSLSTTFSSKCLAVFMCQVHPHPQLLTPHGRSASHFSPCVLSLLVPCCHPGVSPSISSLKPLQTCPLSPLSLRILSPAVFFILCVATCGLVSFIVEIAGVPGLPSPTQLSVKRCEHPNSLPLRDASILAVRPLIHCCRPRV